MFDEDARQELADFLRVRRNRLSPADFGFPATRRRRTPGLRREEVAAAAGVGLTWYTSLEQGKPIQVSTAFLENIARALRLTSAERAHLFALAQRRLPPFSGSASALDGAECLQPILDAVESPAYARNSRFDVLAWNAANTRYFGDFASIPPLERNVIRLMFARSYHRRTMPNWEADAQSLLAKFRLNFGQTTDAGAFLPLITELDAVSATFRRMWAAHDVSDLGEGVTYLCSPRLGKVLFRHQVLMPEAMPDARIIIFLPLKIDPGEKSKPMQD
jgi:transcriptional regulator with XRE-family HTH domain